MKGVKITEKLCLTNIDSNNWKGEKLIAVSCDFTFYGEHGLAYIVIEKLDKDNPRIGMFETYASDLLDSFQKAIEDNWALICENLLRFEEEWIEEQKQ